MDKGEKIDKMNITKASVKNIEDMAGSGFYMLILMKWRLIALSYQLFSEQQSVKGYRP
jgi:hypothetical protein